MCNLFSKVQRIKWKLSKGREDLLELFQTKSSLWTISQSHRKASRCESAQENENTEKGSNPMYCGGPANGYLWRCIVTVPYMTSNLLKRTWLPQRANSNISCLAFKLNTSYLVGPLQDQNQLGSGKALTLNPHRNQSEITKVSPKYFLKPT